MNTPRSSTSSLPPEYASPSDAPTYSAEPYAEECRLAFTPRYQLHTPRNGTVAKKNKAVSVVFHEQDEGSSMPSYVQRESVRGDVILEKPEKVTHVFVQLEARVSLTVSDGGSSQSTVFTRQSILWDTQGQETGPCPDSLSFSLAFPSAWREGERIRALPPSYEVDFPGVPGMYAQFAYFLSVTVKSRCKRFARWRRKSSLLLVPLEYQFRTRPGCPPIPRHFTFLSSVKNIPEEWLQVVSTVHTRWKTEVQPINCHLYIPSVQVFAFSDAIPFHLQLRAPVATLAAFVRGIPHPQQHNTRKPARKPPPGKSGGGAPASIRVYLYRQITIEVRGQKAWRTCVVGEGVLKSLPPPVEDDAHAAGALDWAGDVRCNDDVKVGGFYAGKLNVKDFIVVHLIPACPESSPLLEHQHAHPIRLVTDSFMEDPEGQ